MFDKYLMRMSQLIYSNFYQLPEGCGIIWWLIEL